MPWLIILAIHARGCTEPLSLWIPNDPNSWVGGEWVPGLRFAIRTDRVIVGGLGARPAICDSWSRGKMKTSGCGTDRLLFRAWVFEDFVSNPATQESQIAGPAPRPRDFLYTATRVMS